jgi:hypothetical protein
MTVPSWQRGCMVEPLRRLGQNDCLGRGAMPRPTPGRRRASLRTSSATTVPHTQMTHARQ